MTGTLALFRGCSRLEYKNQNIKLLRATEGEVTRSSYRLLWVHDDALELLRDEPNPIVNAVLVDASNTQGMPVRQMMVVDHSVDAAAGFLHLTFSLGPFLGTALDFTPEFGNWDGGAGECPPEIFVSRWRPSWPTLIELNSEGSPSRWREAIDFLTSSWDFSSTAFFRLGGEVAGLDGGPTLSTVENRELDVRLLSYNPHIPRSSLNKMRLRVAGSGALMTVESGEGLVVDRDGEMEVKLRCLEPGTAHLDITVDPDPQFSTYLPISLDVAADPSLASGRPRVLGREWYACLDGLESHLVSNGDLHLAVLDLLGRVFPDDPAVLQHKGRVHYREGRLAEARALFDHALEMREDAATVAWNLFAALRRGDVRDARQLLTRLNLSQHEFFDDLVALAADLPEGVNLAVASDAPSVFGDEKAMRLLGAMVPTIRSEAGMCTLVESMRAIDADAALTVLLETTAQHPDWAQAVRLVVEIADEVGRAEGTEDHARRALVWLGEDPNEFLVRWHRFWRQLRNPDARIALLMTNARSMFDSRPDATLVAGGLAIEAAEAALAQGDLLLAQDGLVLVFANVRGGDEDSDLLLAEARGLEERIKSVLAETDPVRKGSEEYVRGLYRELRSWTSGKTLLVLGTPTRPAQADEWEAELGVRFAWIGSTPSNPIDDRRIMTFEPSSLIVVALWQHMSHLKPSTKQWMKNNDVPFIQTSGTGGMLLEALGKEWAARAAREL